MRWPTVMARPLCGYLLLVLVKAVRCLVVGANEPFKKTKPQGWSPELGLIFNFDKNGSKISHANPISEQGSPRLASSPLPVVHFTASRIQAEPTRGSLVL